MYDKWLETCSEKELFTFIESQHVCLFSEMSTDKEWIEQTQQNILNAINVSFQFHDNYSIWYQKWRKWHVLDISVNDWIDLLTRMPWNLEKENA